MASIDAKAGLHFACAHGGRGDWDGEDSGALTPADDEADLPGAGGHDPEMAGEELRIGRWPLHRVAARADASSASPVSGMGVISMRSMPGVWDRDLDIGDTGNDERRADDDGELIGTGVALDVDIGAADVSAGCAGGT